MRKRVKKITFDRFGAGLDLRKGASVADANRMMVLTNAFVTNGRVLRKRDGLTKVATLEAGTWGLIAGNGKLNTFHESGTVTHANTLFLANKVAHPSLSQNLAAVHHGEVFSGYLYVSVEYADGSIWHHYLDGTSPSHVSDVNCPHSKAFVKAATKIWAIGDEVVRFTATGAARDWTTADDAGFIPTGRRASGVTDALALAVYKGRLVVAFEDSSQIWLADENPQLHVMNDSVDTVGTRYPRSVLGFAGDVLMLSDNGFRSISGAKLSDSMIDVDVGAAIDPVILPLLDGTEDPLSEFYPKRGQFWCRIKDTDVYTYTFSRMEKISAWAKYTFGITIDAAAHLGGVLYLRSGNDVYKVDDTVWSDNGTVFDMTIEMPYLDFKSPGVLKQLVGVDAIIQGEADLAIRWDPRDESLITDPVTVTGNTQPGTMTPLEIVGTHFRPVITSSSSSEVQIDSLTFYYMELGVR